MDWQPVEKAAKDDAGNFQVLVGGSWRPASKVAKNDAGQYVALYDAPSASAAPAAPPGQIPSDPRLTAPAAIPEEAPVKQSFGQKVMDVAAAPVDVGATMVSGGLGGIIGPIAGMLAGGDEKVKERVEQAITHAPQTQTGRKILQGLGHVAERLGLGAIPGLQGELRALGIGAKAAKPAVDATVAAKAPKLPSFDVSGVLSRATGKTATTEAEALQQRMADAATGRAEAARAAAAPLEKQLTAVERAQQQLTAQPKVAGARAEAKAVDPVRAAAEKIAVREKAAARARALEDEHRKAGATAEQARAAAKEAEGRLNDAQTAVDGLEQELLARPGTSKEQFGEMVRGAVEKLRDKYEGIRGQAAKFGQVIEQAGDEPIVATTGMNSVIQQNLKGIKNPNLQGVLERIQSLIEGGEPGAPRGMQAEMNALAAPATKTGPAQLSLRQADSLKKYLDSIIQTRQVKDLSGTAMAVDKEALAVVRDVKAALMQSMTSDANPKTAAYGQALAKFRENSRPLDIVERKTGALSPVLDADPVSSAYKLTEAQVVGKVIEKARAGNPTFTRLLQESPELKDAARLYFTQDLFGAGAVPTEAGLRTWLKTNAEPLRQLGLLDEFRDMGAARAAAQEAVREAKGGVSAAKAGAGAAEAAETEAARAARSAVKVSKLSEDRLQKALSATPKPEDLAAQSAKRAEAAGRSLEAKGRTVGRTLAQKKEAETRFSTFATELKNTPPKKVAGKVRELADSLVKDGHVTQDEYAQMLQEANAIDKHFADSEATRASLMKVAKYAGIGTGVSLGLFGAGKVFADEIPATAFDDAEKERKYQEWKAKRK